MVCHCLASCTTAEQHFYTSRAKYLAHQNEEALSEINKSIRKGNRSAKAFAQRARIYLDMFRINESLRDCELALEYEPYDPQLWVCKGMNHFALEQYQECITSLNLADSLYPGNAIILDYLGRACALNEDYKLAISIFDRCIQLDSNNSKAYYNRAASKFATNDIQGMNKDLSEAIRLNRNYYDAHYLKAAAAVAGVESEVEKTKIWNELAILFPDSSEAFVKKGKSLARQDSSSMAIYNYSKATQLNAKDTEAFMNKGVEYARQGNHRNAIASFDQAINLDSALGHAYFLRGLSKIAIENLTSAIQDFKSTIRLKSQINRAHMKIGICYNKLGSIKDAKSNFKLCLDHPPVTSIDHRSAGLCAISLEKPGAAFEMLSKAIELDEDDAYAYLLRGKALIELYELDSAKADFIRAQDLIPDYADAIFGEGLVYVEQKDFDRSIEACNRVISINPDHGNAYLKKSWSLSKLGKYNKAIEACEQMIQRKIMVSMATAQIGRIKFQMAKYQEAIKILDDAIGLDPKLGTAHYFRGLSYCKTGDFDNGCKDLHRAWDLGYTLAKNPLDRFCR